MKTFHYDLGNIPEFRGFGRSWCWGSPYWVVCRKGVVDTWWASQCVMQEASGAKWIHPVTDGGRDEGCCEKGAKSLSDCSSGHSLERSV